MLGRLHTQPPPRGRVVRRETLFADLIDRASDDLPDGEGLPTGYRYADLMHAKEMLLAALRTSRDTLQLPRSAARVLVVALEKYGGRVGQLEREAKQAREKLARAALTYFDEGAFPCSGQRATGNKDWMLWDLFGRLDIRGKPRKKRTYDHARLAIDYGHLIHATGRVILENDAFCEAGLAGTYLVDGCPLSREDALACIAWWHNFPSDYACLEQLYEFKRLIREDPSEIYGIEVSPETQREVLEFVGELPGRSTRS